jgi:acetyltransferase-like isoleucine patch superfamily enzyme
MKPVLVPTMDVNSDRATLNAWRVADRAVVAAGDVVAEVETSKAVLDVLAPAAGHLLRAAAVGEEVRLSDPLAFVFDGSAELEAHAARSAAGGGAGDEEPADAPRATLPARRRAAALGIDLSALAGGDGLVTVAAVEAAAARNGGPPPERALPAPVEAPPGVERLALVGAGLGATQVLDILAAGGTGRRAVAIVDDDERRWGEEVGGVPVVGGADRLGELHAAGAFDAAIVSISTSVAARTRLRERCARLGIPLANAIDPTARIATGVTLGTGNVVCAFCHLGVDTRVGDNNFLSAFNSFDHHNVLGSDISTGPGCMTSGLVRIGDRVRLGTGIFVEPHVELGAGVQVASGAVIVGSVPAEHAVKRRVVTTTAVPLRGARRAA